MHRKPGEPASRAGRRWEKFWAARLGRKPHKGSGNQWFVKMDVGDGVITWECKFTTYPSFTITKKMLKECEEKVHENGDDSIPGIAIALDDGEESIVVLQSHDFMRLLGSENVRYITPTKGEQKRRISRTPTVLRDDLQDRWTEPS